MKKAFSNELYVELQSKHIQERIDQFDNKLYLEFGGKLFDDNHASRVLPGFEPDSKLKMLLTFKDKVEVIIAVCAKDLERHKVRSDLGISYDDEVLRLIDEYHRVGLYVGSVAITQYRHQNAADTFKAKLENRGVKVFIHYPIEGYPHDVNHIISQDGFGKNDYIETSKPLVVVTAPGPGSGKMATCLSQLYHEHLHGVNAGYAKFETFPIWNLPLKHPVNLAYEAATIDLNDVNMIDPFHLEKYNETTVNYNRDIEIFPVLNAMFNKIFGESPYASPTDMGVNMAGFCIADDEVCSNASRQEIIRRYFSTRTRYIQELCTIDEVQKQETVMKNAGISEEDRPCVVAARKKQEESKVYSGAIELEDGTLITGKTTSFMGACSSILMNALKYLANIDDKDMLIEPSAFGPIQTLKTEYLGSQNPRLHTNEILIALSLSAQTNENAAKALDQLKNLKGMQAHVTCSVASVDLSVFNNLGIQLTYEAEHR